ncbi:MAG: polymer-forming cytoskeletal protein [Phycisphaeraceae bacterium]|nr:MAG: polymer-forming cytoskeletal protein [Phycisphaeraceae bacterium]
MADKDMQFGTVIGADASFKGDFKFDSAARILGSIEGSISSKGTVHVASGSTCKATITAKEVAVEGAIEGNVEATDRIELKPNGAIKGDIVAAKMTMADGASIDGYCRIGSNGKASTAAEVKPAAAQKAEPVRTR